MLLLSELDLDVEADLYVEIMEAPALTYLPRGELARLGFCNCVDSGDTLTVLE